MKKEKNRERYTKNRNFFDFFFEKGTHMSATITIKKEKNGERDTKK